MKKLTLAILVTLTENATAQTNLYVDTNTQCFPRASTQNVWLQTEGFTLAGWSATRVNQLEGTIIRAINVWNEETNSQRKLVYAGRAVKGQALSAQETLVQGASTWLCTSGGNSAWGRAESLTPSGVDCMGARTLVLFLLTCPAPHAASPFTFYWPGASEVSAEAVLIHELGHAAFGFDDQYSPNPSRGVMWGTLNPGPLGERLHLYRADQDTAIYGATIAKAMGVTTGRTAAWQLNNLNAWIGASPTFLPSHATTFGPALATRHSNSGFYNSAMLLRSTRDVGYTFDTGGSSGWTSLGGMNNFFLTSAQVQHSWVGDAYSRYDEALGAWSECGDMPFDVSQPDNCNVITGYNQVYSGGGWAETVHDHMSISKPEVSYDAWTDRFVLVFIQRDGTLWHSFSPAAYSAWTPPSPLQFTDSVTRHFRYMGGVVFDWKNYGGATGAPSGRYGWVYAATADFRADGVLTPIMQMPLQYNSTAGRYELGAPSLPASGVPASEFDTVRAFDVGDSVDSGVQVMAYLRASTGPWQQRIAVARRTTATGSFTAPVLMPWYRTGVIYSSVAVSSLASLGGEFLISVGGEP